MGCIYGLVALGFVLIYKATELVNFAQGDLLMLGAFVTENLSAVPEVVVRAGEGRATGPVPTDRC